MTFAVFLRSTKVVLSGMAISQSIPLLGSLLISRLYAPSEFGLFSAWLGIVMTAAVFVTGRLEMALGVEHDGEPRRFAMIATMVSIIIACSVLTFITIGAYSFLPAIRDLNLGLILIFLPATFLVAVLQAWQSWAAAEGQYRELSFMRIMQAFGVTGAQILIGYFSPNAVGMSCGYFFGVLVGVLAAVYFMPINFKNVKPLSRFKVQLKAFWLTHHRFPIYALPADLINSASGQLPLLFIASKYGVEFSGLFALSIKVLGAPIGLLGSAVLDVFKRSAAKSYRELGSCRKDYLRTFTLLTALGALFAIAVNLMAESIFVFAFGERWRFSGVISIWLMPMFAMRFVASPLSYVFYIAGKQSVDLVWQCSLFVVTLLAFLMPDNFQMSIKAYAIGYACLYFVYLILSFRYSSSSHA
jgi:O-antigen/teichoic acid export membrane protein